MVTQTIWPDVQKASVCSILQFIYTQGGMCYMTVAHSFFAFMTNPFWFMNLRPHCDLKGFLAL